MEEYKNDLSEIKKRSICMTTLTIRELSEFLENPDCFDLVEWVLFDTHTESVYESVVDKIY